jgi:hypothetical protein
MYEIAIRLICRTGNQCNSITDIMSSARNCLFFWFFLLYLILPFISFFLFMSLFFFLLLLCFLVLIYPFPTPHPLNAAVSKSESFVWTMEIHTMDKYYYFIIILSGVRLELLRPRLAYCTSPR